MSENLVYKNEYDSDDVYLRDLQTVFNEIAEKVDKNEIENDYYGSNSLGIVIYANRYTNIVLKDAAIAAQKVFEDANGSKLDTAIHTVEELLKSHNPSRYDMEYTGWITLMSDYKLLMLSYDIKTYSINTALAAEMGLSEQEIAVLNSEYKDITELQPMRNERQEPS